jgi:hypothetical protein
MQRVHYSLLINLGKKQQLPADPAYILEGKGSPLYRADDLGAGTASTPAKLTGLNLQTYLGDGKTVEIVTDPMQYKRTIEYHTDAGTSPLHQMHHSGAMTFCWLMLIVVVLFQ